MNNLTFLVSFLGYARSTRLGYWAELTAVILICLVLVAGGVWYLRRSPGIRRVLVPMGMIVVGAVAITACSWLASTFRISYNQYSVAMELGVDPQTIGESWRFPENYVRPKIIAHVTTREQVHELLKFSRRQVRCGNNLEYFYLLSTRDDPVEAQILQVEYDNDNPDIVYIVERIDSYVPSLANCLG